jgi:FKBP-type peptidyl-prolyl cis-trans isomerase 2
VVAVDEDAVTVDLNHPYAGKRLRFVGRVVEIG